MLGRDFSDISRRDLRTKPGVSTRFQPQVLIQNKVGPEKVVEQSLAPWMPIEIPNDLPAALSGRSLK
jgi:hypothetical protein